MRLISKEDVAQVGRVCFAGKSFESNIRAVSKVFQYFKYT